MSNLIFIYIINPSKEKAKEIAKLLVEKKLIACANIFPINSIYHWEEKIVDEEEFVLLAKTTEDKYKEVKEEVESIHSYSIPCILKIPIEANEKYDMWLRSELE